ncbi:hypothetical protein BDA99DRAFT_543189 [Phascolomyces articulosus]|uniref:Uncharacterized protein n=1 Tax=Phascolomyces articulosus TaxID=60185 RepID=A0AAD5P9R4_9FUNG|nr:hypothetical protein BDA99DRAFT_543189 [Phascolomyces articulosus]
MGASPFYKTWLLLKLFQHSPQLEWLDIENTDDIIYEIIDTYCPNIKVFVQRGTDEWNAENEHFYHDPSPGMKVLKGELYRARASAVIPLLQKHHSTLRILDLGYKDTDSYSSRNNEVEDVFTVFPYNNLTYLHISYPPPSAGPLMKEQLQLIPNLTTLSLACLRVLEGTLQYLNEIPHLTTLIMRDVRCTQDDIFCCFGAFAQNRAKSSLKKLHLIKCNVSDPVVEEVAKIKSLTELLIHYSHMFGPDPPGLSGVTGFTKGIARLPKLNHLNIGFWRFKKNHLKHLCKSKSLREVVFFFVDGITDDEAYNAFSPNVNVRFVESMSEIGDLPFFIY